MKRNFTLPSDDSRIITACLGPTNTGKTTYAIDRMMSYQSGVIGFPLRLLARENYDRVVREKGVSKVALVTGEEKILPKDAQYFICTVEAMPIERDFEFLAIDEVQLCSDPERGHVFTDRLLRARGKSETIFLGAETMRPIIKALIPETKFESRPRLSELTYTGFKKLSRLRKRSAVVAFSIDDVYRYAEMIRRHRGGTAIVLGALSPRARNAQVELYQSGEVDFMVATDAIGMGLNMDIQHVALAATRKYDGKSARHLNAAELAQIAGRAGRAKTNGTFGVTGHVRDLDEGTVEAIRTHTFPPLEKIIWRNHDLEFNSPKALLNSLERKSGSDILVRGRTSDDHATLAALSEQKAIIDTASAPDTVRLLWEVCQIPDFRKTLSDTHQALIAEIYFKLLEGTLPEDWTHKQIKRLDDTNGDVDALMSRIAHIRTWTFITHRAGWLKDSEHWQAQTRAIEDKLSDALHEALTRRFVDRRTSVLVKAMEEKGEDLLAGIKKDGSVIVEGQKIGDLVAFTFIPDDKSGGTAYKSIMSAARSALKQEIKRRMSDILNSEPSQFRLQENGDVCYQSNATNPLPGDKIARIKKGDTLYAPDVILVDSDLLSDIDKSALQTKIKAALKTQIDTTLEPLINLTIETDDMSAQARGIAHQLHENLGIMPRSDLDDLISGLDSDGRSQLRGKKVRLGPILVYIPLLGKPAAVKLKALLWNLWNDQPLPAKIPRDGSVSEVVEPKKINKPYYQSIGYPVYGARAIRADMLDRLVCEIYDSAKDGKFEAQHKMAEWLGCPIAELYEILSDLGHKKVHDPADEQDSDTAEQKTEENIELKFVPAIEDDRAFFIQAHHASYRKTVEEMFGWDETFQDEMASKAFDNGGMHIVWNGEEKIGVIGWEDRENHIWLKEVFILPEHQNQGFGSFMVKHTLSKAKSENKDVKLQTLTANLGAKKLYERHGFEVTGTTDIHWQMACKTIKESADKTDQPATTAPEKPKLATFILKRGKAAAARNPNRPAHKKPFKKDQKKHGKKSIPPRQKTITAKAKQNDEDNPFAVLAQLKGK